MRSCSVLRNRKALSTVVATIFFMAIAIVIFMGSYLEASRTATAMSKYDQEVVNERIAITRTEVDATGYGIIVFNEGNEKARLVALWLINDAVHERHELEANIWLSPKEAVTLEGSGDYTAFDGGTAKVVTERGNLAEAPIPYAPSPPVGPGDFPIITFSDIVADASDDTLTFDATNIGSEDMTVEYVSVDTIDWTGSRAGAVYWVDETVAIGETRTIGPIDLRDPTYGRELDLKVPPGKSPDFAMIELYIEIEDGWYLLGKASTIAVE